jgi:hypothetical protein
LAARALSHDGLSLDFTSRSILECYADALDARAGDPAARGRLLSRVASRQAPDVCAILAADLEAEPARGALIRQAFQPTSGQWSAGSYGLSIGDLSDVDAYAFVLLDGEGKTSRYNGRPPEWYPLHGLRGLRYYVLVRPLGLEAARRENETEPAALQVEDPLTIAAFDSYVGEHADAAREYGRALTLARVADAYAGADSGTFRYQRPAWAAKDPDAFERTINELDHRRFFFLGATLALRARDVDSARTLMAMAHGETHGTRMLSPFLTVLSPELKAAHAAAFNEIEENETWAPSKRLWAFAARGHAADIPARLRNAKEDGRGVVAFVANEDGVLPELRSFVETGYPPPCWACGPHALVDWIAGRREAAQAAGATALDASLGVAARRLQALFLRRDIAVPLYALGRVASF